MRIEIHRWRMAMSPRNDGRVAVGYDLLVPLKDCVPKNSSNIEVLHGDRRYMHYPHATWSTDLPPCWTRYEAWLAHEREAERQMLRFLHEHCPETHELDEWPTLWAYIDPEHANDLHTVHVTIPPAAAAPPSAGAAA